jgi:GTP diphosphokinase / guanosine-3',5'-bis(diphosphate) 3'-diphosphatase
MPVRYADGGAVPGDRIVGILTPGEGITIYPIQSPALKAFDDEPDRWLDVRWDVEDERHERFPARIEVTAINEPGTLAQIAQVIAENDGNISNLRIDSAADFSAIAIDLEVFDAKHLARLIAQLRARPVVSAVTRVNA